MTNEDFRKILESRIEKIRTTLSGKAKGYGKEDRLYNFKRAASIQNITPESALLGMFTKHLVSVLDIIEGKIGAEANFLDEKIGDSINYLILLEAVLLEKSYMISSAYIHPGPKQPDYEQEPKVPPIKLVSEKLSKNWKRK